MKDYEVIKELSEGYSRQSKTSNQFWITLIIASIITITAQPDTNNLVELPFTLGKVKTVDFYSIVLILICVLSIAYASAMIQAIRARKLIQKVIDNMDEKFYYSVHIQDILDCMLIPTYNRVAPISQFLLGKNQFYGELNPNKYLIKLITVFYVILKITTYIFLYIVPVYSILLSWDKICAYESDSIIIKPYFLIGLIVISLIVLLIVIIGDLKYLWIVIKRIKKQ
jgi:hypothetical protein